MRNSRRQSTKPPNFEGTHWLGAGVWGQESLLDEISPELYALDSWIASSSASHFHRGELNPDVSEQEKPFALLMPALDSIGWQLGYLSKHYRVYLRCSEDEDASLAAADCFNAMLFESSESVASSLYIDFALDTQTTWPSWDALAEHLAMYRSLLDEKARLYFVLAAEEREGILHLPWTEGGSTPLETVLSCESNGRPLGLGSGRIEQKICMPSEDPHDPARLHGFLKRNREYFGRSIREQLVARLGEPDFASAHIASSERISWALFVSWCYD